jgi:hypothetical protein
LNVWPLVTTVRAAMRIVRRVLAGAPTSSRTGRLTVRHGAVGVDRGADHVRLVQVPPFASAL